MPKVQKSALYRWCFTIQAPKDEPFPDHTVVSAWLHGITCDRYVFQHEKVDRHHYQGSLKLRDKQRATRLLNQWEECTGLCKNYLTVQPMAHRMGAFLYAMKEKSRVDGPWSDRPIYLGQDLKCMDDPFPWQKTILEMIAMVADDRTVVWIVDEEGNTGKSKMVKYCRWKRLAYPVPQGTATQIKTYIVDGGPHLAYFVDLPRTSGDAERMNDIYSALEGIKNGMVLSAMYGKHRELIWAPPHVVVFSNLPPKRSKMSKDRWLVMYIESHSLALAL